MAATAKTSIIALILSSLSSSSRHSLEPMFFLFFFFTFFLLSFSILITSLYNRSRKFYNHEETEQPSSKSTDNCCLPSFADKTQETHESNITHLSHSLLLDMLPSNSPKWATLEEGHDPDRNGSDKVDSGEEEFEKKKKKKRAKKKRSNSTNFNVEEEEREGERVKRDKQELVCLFPFTSTSSVTQRKMKQHYDQLVKSNESNGLTLAQVANFANVLIEARNELRHKSGIIQRKFTITKALLFKADRSSFDRLRQQIYKLELEQKRLQEDTFVYNWLHEQLRLSPAFKKILEIGAFMEFKAKADKIEDSKDNDYSYISFEDFLAQEKKDSFWFAPHLEPNIHNSFQNCFSFVIFLYAGKGTGSQDRAPADDEVAS